MLTSQKGTLWFRGPGNSREQAQVGKTQDSHLAHLLDPNSVLKGRCSANRSINSTGLEQSQVIIQLALPLLKPMCNYTSTTQLKIHVYFQKLNLQSSRHTWRSNGKSYIGCAGQNSWVSRVPVSLRAAQETWSWGTNRSKHVLHRMLNLTIQLPLWTPGGQCLAHWLEY